MATIIGLGLVNQRMCTSHATHAFDQLIGNLISRQCTRGNAQVKEIEFCKAGAPALQNSISQAVSGGGETSARGCRSVDPAGSTDGLAGFAEVGLFTA